MHAMCASHPSNRLRVLLGRSIPLLTPTTPATHRPLPHHQPTRRRPERGHVCLCGAAAMANGLTVRGSPPMWSRRWYGLNVHAALPSLSLSLPNPHAAKKT